MFACSGRLGGGSGGNSFEPIDVPLPATLSPTPLRRLTRTEYLRSVSRILSVEPSTIETYVNKLTPDSRQNTFENDSRDQSMDVNRLEAYLGVAESLGKFVSQDPKYLSQFSDCDIAQEACFRPFIGRVGRRLFRRPLREDEVNSLWAIKSKGETPNEGTAHVFQAMLSAPTFIYRIETGRDQRPNQSSPLTDYEVASRLAFFIWAEGPDDALLDAAERGELSTVEGVTAQVQRMLSDARAQQGMQLFTDQWFDLDSIFRLTRSSSEFPEFSPALVQSMYQEARSMLDEHVWQDKAFLDVYATQTHYVDSALASIYGVNAATGTALAPYKFSNDPNRGGFFTTAAFATVTSLHDYTSLIHRGVFLLDRVLCSRPPEPETVPPLEPNADPTLRLSNGACSGCHSLIDPLGNGFERYDSIGRIRTQYPGNVRPLPVSGNLNGPGGPKFEGGVGFGNLMRDDAKAQACFVSQLGHWALGRRLSAAEDAVFRDLESSLNTHQGRIQKLIAAIATHGAFRHCVKD